MKTLDPEEFLRLLKSLGHGQTLPISSVEVGDFMEDGMFRVDLKLGDKPWHFYLPAEWTKEIGGLHFMEFCVEARTHAESVVAGRLGDYYESTYKEWVYNDTGYNINASFEELIINEITRLEEEFTL